MRSTCFIDNFFFRDAPIIVQGAQFVSEGNSGALQADLTCPFIAFFEDADSAKNGEGAICTGFDADECQVPDDTDLEDMAVSSPLKVKALSQDANGSDPNSASSSVGPAMITIALTSIFIYGTFSRC
jgi:hypothetical protein